MKKFSTIKNSFGRPVNILLAGIFIFTLILQPLPASLLFAAPELSNADLETTSPSGVPECFTQAGWGDHTATWEIVADAHSGSKAQSLTIVDYASGDKKLMMTENLACAPDVVAGNTYDLSVWYKSTTASNSLTIFRHSAAGWTYWTDLKQLPAADVWTEAKATTPAVPDGTDQISFGISLSSNGTLITDDYGFALTPADTTTDPEPEPEPTPEPLPEGELTANGGLEEGGATPTGWMLAGWGDADITGEVVADAHAGTRAYSITLAGRTMGDYKLLPVESTAPAVEPGKVYNLSTWYKSTTDRNSLTVFAHTASGWGYWTDIQTLPAVSGWTEVAAETPEIPAGVDAIAWGISISGNGTLITDDYSTTEKGDALPPPDGDLATQGEWTVLKYEMPIRSIHSTLLNNGKVLMIAGSGNDVDNFEAGIFKNSVWDPVSGVFHTIDTPKDMFCAGHVTLPDGRVLIQGGTRSYPSTPDGGDYGGLKDSWIFDPDTNTFTAIDDANEGHWYPTLVELGNGDVWMAGGLKEDATGAVNTEYFDYETEQWLPTGQVPQSWSFWGLYPSMHLMADGRLFYSGTHTFGDGLPGTGASIYDPATGTIAEVPGLREKDMRDQSTSVLLPPAQDQRVIIAGGGNINGALPGIALTDIIDLKEASPEYQPGPDLPGGGKMYVNSTILPDRTVLFSNGGKLNRDDSTNVMTAEIFNPLNNTMNPVAADPIGRNYHSSAVLLPDGRVVALGSNPGDGSFEMRISIYKPPYFFKGTRPEVTSVPADASYGENFSFNVASENSIQWAQLIRPMSVTHQTDANMRLVDLPIIVEDGVATVTVPENSNLLPPGPYMLTVTDVNGVPSNSTWVSVQ